ncbi:uncharacterized protein LOC144162897, partial [Haemaphysalis longicornis]
FLAGCRHCLRKRPPRKSHYGRFQNRELCPAGTYGHVICRPCPPNAYSLKAGSAFCEPCPPGAFVGPQCHPARDGLLQLTVALVMKYGLITCASASVLLGLTLCWLMARKNAHRRKKVLPSFSPVSTPSSEELLISRQESLEVLDSCRERFSDEAESDREEDGSASCLTTTVQTLTSTSSAQFRQVEERDDDRASSDDSGVVGDGASGDASPTKQRMLQRLKEQGAVLPVKGVDIKEIQRKAQARRGKEMPK